MKLENQVTNLELSKKIDELGIKQESLYSYIFTERMNCDTKDGDWHDWRLDKTIENPTDTCGEQISAYTVSELGEMLSLENIYPNIIKTNEKVDTWCINYTKSHQDHADTEANARAKMLIYLYEK